MSDVTRLEKAAAFLQKMKGYSPSFDDVKALVALVDTCAASTYWGQNVCRALEQASAENERLKAELTCTQAQLVELDQENERLKAAYDLLSQDYAGADADRKGLAEENERLKAQAMPYSLADVEKMLTRIDRTLQVRFDQATGEWLHGPDTKHSATSVVCCVLDYFLPKGPTA